MLRASLPDQLTLADGTVLFPIVGGQVLGKPFVVLPAGRPFTTSRVRAQVAEAKRRGLRYRRVEVLDSNLRGKRGLDRQLYQPTTWVFIEDPPESLPERVAHRRRKVLRRRSRLQPEVQA